MFRERAEEGCACTHRTARKKEAIMGILADKNKASMFDMCHEPGLNRRPPELQSVALPAELSRQ